MEKTLEIKKEKKEQDWTEKELLIKWEQFNEKIKKTKKTNLYNILGRYCPQKQNNELVLEVVSLSEKSAIEEIKIELLEFLKNELNNDFIKLTIYLSKEEAKNMLHTKQEKYEYMLNANGKIKLLQDELNLNII